MIQRLPHYRLLRLGGYFVWLCALVPLILLPVLEQQWHVDKDWFFWALSLLVFVLAYSRLTSDTYRGKSSESLFLLLLMATSSVAVSYYSQSGLGIILSLVLAGLLPWLMRVTAGVIWLVVMNILFLPVFIGLPDSSLSQALVLVAVFMGFALFIYITALVARKQSRAREELRMINSQLRATQSLLGESSRMAERLRISRELHDLVGHHLTALSLNLEVASHLVSGKALEHVDQAKSIARLLLADVREVVSNLRQDDRVDIHDAVSNLVEGVPDLNVELDMPRDFNIKDPEQAHVLLRTAQEAVTNCVRHAEADRLQMQFFREGSRLGLRVADNGVGASMIEYGNGLRGMRERLVQLGGELHVESRPGQGLRLEASLPLGENYD